MTCPLLSALENSHPSYMLFNLLGGNTYSRMVYFIIRYCLLIRV